MSVSRTFDIVIITGACIPHKKKHYELFFGGFLAVSMGVFASNVRSGNTVCNFAKTAEQHSRTKSKNGLHDSKKKQVGNSNILSKKMKPKISEELCKP